MFIYIDESGTFAHPSARQNSYACAGALTVPERNHGGILKSFKTLKRKWGRLGEDIKGRELDESQVSQVIRMLVQNGAKFHACATDMLHNTPELTRARKDEQAKRLLANISDGHYPNLVRQMTDIGNKLRAMSDQLFLQLCVMIELINAQLHDMMIYFSRSGPQELGAFRWVADRKGSDKTTYEELWQILLPWFIQGRQFSDDFDNKIVFLEGGDYSYCKRFFRRIDKWPEYLPEQKPGLRERIKSDVVDLNLILKESFSLEDSAERPGIQLADIVTNALRRALMGNLQHEGWCELGRLMFRWKDKSIRLVHFGDGSRRDIPLEDEHATQVIMAIMDKAGFVL